VDANKNIGMGHLSRCMSLANELKKFQINSCFFINHNKDALELITKHGFHCFSISKNCNEYNKIRKLHHRIKFNAIFIDLRKTYTDDFLLKIKKICKVIVIGNTNYNRTAIDLLILPWIREQYPRRLQLNSKILIGSKYAILGTTNRMVEKKLRNSILISLGGSDKRNLTLRIVRAFQKYNTKFHVTIIIGKFFTKQKEIPNIIKNDKRFTIIQNSNDLASIMRKHCVGIFSFGITALEAFQTGLPCVVLTHSKENDRFAKKTEKYHCMRYLGYYREINYSRLPETIFSIMENSKLCRRYVNNGKKLVDGYGSVRIAKKIAQLI